MGPDGLALQDLTGGVTHLQPGPLCVTRLVVHMSGQVRFAWAGAMHPQLRASWQSKEVTFPDVVAAVPTTGS